MIYIRKIERNKLKAEQGNKKIRKAWRQYQINRYSIQGFCDIYNKNKPKERMIPPKVYNV